MDRDELIPGIPTTTFAGIVLAWFVTNLVRGRTGGATMTDLVHFSGRSESTLTKMRDAEKLEGVHCDRPLRCYQYSPTKYALGQALAESLVVGYESKGEHARMHQECRP